MAATLASMFGDRTQGQDVRTGNVIAVQALSNILKTSLGPQGLDKMLVDEVGDVTVTNDGATILKQLEVEHPAAKVLVNLSDLQDKEVGDGTTSVVLIAAELLKRAHTLVKNGIHPTSVISGYKLAMKVAVKFVKEHQSESVEKLGKDILVKCAMTSLNSKYIGVEAEFFANLIVDAVSHLKMVNMNGQTKYPVKSVNVLCTHGRSTRDSFLVKGYALQMGRAGNGMPTEVKQAKIALLDFNLRQHRMQLGVQVQVDNPDELEKIREKEKDITKQKINKILASGANVVLTTQGIDDMSLKYFVEAGVLALRRVDKKDMKRIAKATGGRVTLTLASLESEEGDESFDPAWLGTCGQVVEERVGDWDYIFFNDCTSAKATTLVLRGSSDTMLAEVERSAHDAMMAVSKALESNQVVAGGGCVEAALSVHLDDFARTLGSREQLAVAEFSEALLVIPKTLAINAAQDATELIARLKAAHTKAQTSSADANLKWTGIDLVKGDVRNALQDGVVEPLLSKVKSLRFATEAAITILRIDDVIKVAPEEPQRQ
eukprot:GHVN01095036.1.p1 GENE.GHVN01095036.1~~GHVN01095036.1.p1  ORF type:complete len:546 (+),score=112.11 GHVN01095036.1:54-1691(+)